VVIGDESGIPRERVEEHAQTSLPGSTPTVGYGAVAEFTSSDLSLWVYRRFGWLTARRLAYLQDELCELEEDLESLDARAKGTGADDELKSRRVDPSLERKAIMSRLDTKLIAYRMVSISPWLIIADE